MATFIRKTREELEQERASLLIMSGLSEEALRSQAELYQVTPEQMDILSTIEGIDWLLGGDD